MAKAHPIEFAGDMSKTTKPNITVGLAHLGLVFAGVELTDEDIARTKTKIEKLNKEIYAINGRLNNESYLAKAPKNVVLKAKTDLTSLVAKLEEVKRGFITC